MGRFIVLAALVAAAFGWFYWGARTPAPLPASAPAQAFSAGRGLEDVRHIAAVPHPIGSAQNQRVRDYLLGRMRTLGLAPQVQRTEAQNSFERGPNPVLIGGTVENLIGVLPGRRRDLPALVIMAHYDSVPGSPGAADDAAGVASGLEIVRAIRARGTPVRDVIVLLTDGEEAGLLGAKAFFDHHPLAMHAGFVMNLEARGGGGRTAMFQTGPGNGPTVDLYRRTARQPQSNSLTVLVYKMMPNDTDFTVSSAHALPGLNYAFIGRQFDYHSPTSTVANLDQGALQHMLTHVGPTAMAVAFSETLPARGQDVVYGALPGGFVAAYPPLWGYGVLALGLVLTGVGAMRARAAKALSWRDLWKGVGTGALLLVGSGLLLSLTRLATGVGFGWFEGRALLARFAPFEAAMVAAGLGFVLLTAAALARGKAKRTGAIAALVAGGAVAALGGFTQAFLVYALGSGVVLALLAWFLFARAACLAGTWTGLIVTGLGLALAAQIAAPTAALALAWPVAAAALVSALTGAGAKRDPVALAVAFVVAALGLAWIGDFLHGLLQGLDLPFEVGPGLTVWLGAMLLWPFAWPAAPESRASYAPGGVALAGGLAIAIFLHFTNPWSPRHPQTAFPLFAVEPASGNAWRVAVGAGAAPSPYMATVMAADGAKAQRRQLPGFERPVLAAPAQSVVVTAPAVTISKGADGLVTISAPMGAAVSLLGMTLTADTFVGDVKVNGRPSALLARPGRTSRLSWTASDGVTVTFRPKAPGSISVDYTQYLAGGWPAAAKPLPPMPKDVMGFDRAGSTVVVGHLKQAW